MQRIYKRWFGKGLLATGMACCLMLALATGVLASTVHVYDQAGVLNASQVQNAARKLSYPLDIYTTKTFNGDSSSFTQQTQSHVTSSNLIVMAIDTVHHYLAIEGGSSVPLSNSQYQDAVTAFKNNYNNGDYTGATIAAINSLGNALGSSSSSGSTSGGLPTPTSGLGGFGFSTLCCIGLLVLGALALFAVFRRRRRGVFAQPQPPMGGPYGQPYQGYPPNYGPGYNQGMNPWVAGGLGAAAGGLAGYELGRESAENQQQGGGNEGNFGGGNNIGGGAEGSFGNGGDFGGGAGGGFGGGGDFGGGGGGDFGGGGGGGGASGSF